MKSWEQLTPEQQRALERFILGQGATTEEVAMLFHLGLVEKNPMFDQWAVTDYGWFLYAQTLPTIEELTTELCGLHLKYAIHNRSTGGMVDGAFVLRPEKDTHARTALRAYAQSVQHENPTLAKDIMEWLLSLGDPDAIYVGMGATEILHSDRHACTVVWVSSDGKKAKIQQDKAIRTDSNGMSDVQSYSYEPNPDAAIRMIRKFNDGCWYTVYNKRAKGNPIRLGVRREFYDYSF
ncbi:hypothetical protein Rctr85_082 [Virus Rctr85]|nr:hypothetical protein Rctr85_082 [Virus Rctr85]